ncbi:MAG: type II toxin-antitoxin system HicA family toxin [Acidimicrobiales bacterium]|nr:type II toxin-antitoxin system HicA family toxin [Acidimicrobiales bacterium]
MNPPIPQVSGREVVRALGRVGFEQVGQRGSHVKLRNQAGRVVIVPMHREFKVGTLRSIIRQSGVIVDDFIGLLS